MRDYIKDIIILGSMLVFSLTIFGGLILKIIDTML
jgi:hypothetical protein